MDSEALATFLTVHRQGGVSAAATGASFTGLMVRLKVSESLSDPSLVVIFTATTPLKSCGGVPENTRCL